MTAPWREWLVDAVDVLESPPSTDEAIDAVVAEGLAMEPAAGMDPEKMHRVLSCLQVRRAALAVELGDIARRRTELARARTATSGYLNAGGSVPME